MEGGRTHICITWSRGLWGGLEGGQGTESTETLLWICSILLPGVLLQFWSHRLHLQSVTLKFFRDRSFRPHFEHSENPFYDVQHYKVSASNGSSMLQMLFQGDGKFSREQVRVGSPGGIFNIEFSGDGKVLAAACERKSILLFDPLTRCLHHIAEGITLVKCPYNMKHQKFS